MTEESVLTAPPRATRTVPASRSTAKFAVVGAFGAVLNTAVLYVLYEWFHLPLLIASAVAVETAVISNYLWNDRWTFAAPSRSLHRFAKFNVSALGGLAINMLSVALLTFFGMHLVLANAVGIAAGFVANFRLSSTWVWATT